MLFVMPKLTCTTLLALQLGVILLLVNFPLGVEGKTKYLLTKRPQCSEKNQRKIEYLLARAMVFGPNGRPLPESLAGVKEFCRETNRLVAKIETFFNACYTKTVRNYANIIIYTAKAELRKYCKKGGNAYVRENIKFAPCANKYIVRNETCFQKFIEKTKGVMQLKEDRLKISYSCCNFVAGVQCAEEFLEGVPCLSKEHINNFMDLFRAGMQGNMDLLCGEFNEESDACARLGPVPKPIKPDNRKYIAYVYVFIDLLESLKDPDAPAIGFL